MKPKLQKLHEGLIDALTEDLNDPTTRGPGLYAVIRGVLNDHKESLDLIPSETMESLENKMAQSAPFKIKVS
jgi:hypothetical protein